MKKTLMIAAFTSTIVASCLTASAMAATVPDSPAAVSRAAATKYNLIFVPGSTFEPEFVAGSQYTWEELCLVLIDFNLQRGHNERANYLSIAMKDKAYYFFGG